MPKSTSDDQSVAIVFVQGSFQTPLVYKKLTDGLKNHGFPTSSPELPSCSNTEADDFPTKTLDDDTDAVRRVLEQLVLDEGKAVVVVMHSYGGLVGSNAIPKELGISYRKAAGLAGGVIHLFYFAAFVVDEGQSVLSAFGQSPHNDVKDDGTFSIKNAGALLYNDLPESEAAEWESRLFGQSYAVQTTKATCAAYKYVPSTYLLCENDKAVPLQLQETFAGSMGSKVLRCDAGHSPMLSQPDVLVKHIVAAVEDAVREVK